MWILVSQQVQYCRESRPHYGVISRILIKNKTQVVDNLLFK